ncbi:hydrogenase maturation nickel metallochaperone HypA [Haloarcula sp. S1CR25-12]|uniref:Hydrogenase maturation nickel metallochaperone HypA n=1 Tax=Haloarcula saliterrae TaxID=2950534 RepID=A0ABU2FHW9_9EURY|nr:hypothetical protein [Haloarcula sp. S1CR25-12]MDS0261290.1 hydrogenase maturation nickel metallochaperone HypA [Haloarcula sp. S1CR25-12]
MTLKHPPTSEQRPAKARLFCPTCDHESPLDGDWIGDDTTPRRRLLCPRCGDCVVDQPRV